MEACSSPNSTLPGIMQKKKALLLPKSRKDTLLLKQTPFTIQTPVKWKQYDIRGWRPEAREGATWTTINIHKGKGGESEERSYLFGGLSRDLHSEITYLTYDVVKCKKS